MFECIQTKNQITMEYKWASEWKRTLLKQHWGALTEKRKTRESPQSINEIIRWIEMGFSASDSRMVWCRSCEQACGAFKEKYNKTPLWCCSVFVYCFLFFIFFFCCSVFASNRYTKRSKMGLATQHHDVDHDDDDETIDQRCKSNQIDWCKRSLLNFTLWIEHAFRLHSTKSEHKFHLTVTLALASLHLNWNWFSGILCVFDCSLCERRTHFDVDFVCCVRNRYRLLYQPCLFPFQLIWWFLTRENSMGQMD